MADADGRRIPASTYRLQLWREFGFDRAAELTAYLSRLGVDACYCSPIVEARPGSRHGYDIVNHNEINPELGGDAAFLRFVEAVQRQGLMLIVDFVPNHMAADVNANPWWRDVVENGEASPHAGVFDIEWHPLKPELHGRLLLPILRDHYGRVLERGELVFEYLDGAFIVRYGDLKLPVGREHTAHILGPELAAASTEAPASRDSLVQAVAAMNGTPGNASSFDRLHELLELQPYRLAFWRVAGDEINYRRFFDVNDLAAIRMERKDVFDVTHRRLAEWLADGLVQGVRVDHPDGLFDPTAYFERLSHLAGVPRPYLVVEKILGAAERLPPEWPVDGTTGYDFLNDTGGVFVDPSAGRLLHRIYGQVSGRQARFADVVYESKKRIMATSLSSELNVLADALNRLSEFDRRSRDFTHESLRDLLIETIACFPIYRTYISARGASAADVRAIDDALTAARQRNPTMGRSVFEFLRCVLLPAGLPGVEDNGNAFEPRADFAERLRFAMAFQQYTAPVQAKGLEDTAFYRYNALISLNEVGGDPGRFGRTVAEFHAANAARRADWPVGMLATSTHDTKLGEDTRIRLHVVSELAAEWRTAVTRWQRLTSSARQQVDGGWAPDGADTYRFYQALVGIWPVDGQMDAAVVDQLAVRLRAYMTKALREAKTHTSWVNENAPYEAAVDAFITRVLTGRQARRFLDAVAPLARRIAALGAVYSLSQLVLKLTSPGVPDFYQGSELWTLTLVDPDNRTPVDFQKRAEELDAIGPLLEGLDQPATRVDRPELLESVRQLAQSWPVGRIKLFVTAAGLHLRRAHRELFLTGDYIPLDVEPASPARAIAFARRLDDRVLITVVPRLLAAISPHDPGPAASCAWGDTHVSIPEELAAGGAFVNVLTGERVRPASRQNGLVGLEVSSILGSFPVALLWRTR